MFIHINKRRRTWQAEMRLSGSNVRDLTSSQHHSNAFHEGTGLVVPVNP